MRFCTAQLIETAGSIYGLGVFFFRKNDILQYLRPEVLFTDINLSDIPDLISD